jgi:hypothetical protein
MSHQGFDSTFKEFKQDFYSRAGDGTVFNVLDINLLKIVLEGLKVKFTSRSKIVHYFDRPVIAAYVYFAFRLISDIRKRKTLNSKIANRKEAKCIVGFSDRAVKIADKEYSLYFQKIFEEFGREHFFFLNKHKSTKVETDIELSDLTIGFNVFSSYNIRLFLSMKKWLKAGYMLNTWSKAELENIKAASFLFYMDYLKYDSLLKKRKFTTSLLICHYHNEAFILACKRNKIPVNELQHGLIAKEDIFYVFPPQVSAIIPKALFPDTVLVYGEYWKDLLLQGAEYPANAIRKLGYYHYENPDKVIHNKLGLSDKKIILVTTQNSASSHFVDFIKGLSPKLSSDWHIVVKLHPAENISEYSGLQPLQNVDISDENLDAWILRSEFIVTIFSTTIFDAARLGKPAFALNIKLYEDYVQAVVSSGAASLLEPTENPLDKLSTLKSVNNTIEFYANFNRPVLQKVLAGHTGN